MKFAKQNVRIRALESRNNNKLTKKAVPLKVRGSLEVANTLSRSTSLQKFEQKFAESEKLVKIFYSDNSLFIGAREGSFKNPPRSDRCDISG
jgi:hypothetical protein